MRAFKRISKKWINATEKLTKRFHHLRKNSPPPTNGGYYRRHRLYVAQCNLINTLGPEKYFDYAYRGLPKVQANNPWRKRRITRGILRGNSELNAHK